MGKKSQKRVGRYDKAQTGCIWTFISIFDFRNGRTTRRLLSNRRNSRRHLDETVDFKTKQQMGRNSTGELQQSQECEEGEGEKLDLGKVSVKELMEKEMVIDTNGRFVKRNHKRWNSYGSKSDIEVLEDLVNGQSRGLDLEAIINDQEVIDTNGRSVKRNHKRWNSYGSKSDIEVLKDLANGQSRSLDLEAIINDICLQIRQERTVRLKPDDDNTKSDEKLDKAIQMFVVQKLKNEKDLTVEGRTDVVRALQSNKDAIIKHLKEKKDSPSKRSQSFEENLLNEDHRYPASTAKLNSSLEKKQILFSFTEIKRRLMNAMKKDRSGKIALLSNKTIKNGNMEKMSAWNSPTKNRDYNEKYAIPFRGNRKKERNESLADIYIEARKHLSEIILGNGAELEHCSSSSRRSPRSLARLLSLTEFNFSSPRRDIRSVSDTLEKNLSYFDNFQENGEEINKKTQHFYNAQVLNEIDQSSGKDDMEIVITKDASADSEISLQVGSKKLDDLEVEVELLPSSPLSSSPTSPIIKNKEHNERSEKPSPVSILDPIFGEEDDISPSSMKPNPDISAAQPQLIKFEDFSSTSEQEIHIGTSLEDEESAFEFVEAILLSSDLKWDDFLHRWISSDPVLDPSLIHEVESFSTRSLPEQKLLFDGTNEVLEEVCQRYFSLSPQVSFLKHIIRPVPKGQDLIQEVWEEVESNLLQPSPFVLEFTVRRDMAEKWIDLRLHTEDICLKLCDDILEELLQETEMS